MELHSPTRALHFWAKPTRVHCKMLHRQAWTKCAPIFGGGVRPSTNIEDDIDLLTDITQDALSINLLLCQVCDWLANIVWHDPRVGVELRCLPIPEILTDSWVTGSCSQVQSQSWSLAILLIFGHFAHTCFPLYFLSCGNALLLPVHNCFFLTLK